MWYKNEKRIPHNHDWDGKLIAKAIRSKNRLYKVHMRVREHLSLLTTTTGDSSWWHARLGHINIETMRSMIQWELVIGVPQLEIEKRVCGSCLMGKQTRKSFPHIDGILQKSFISKSLENRVRDSKPWQLWFPLITKHAIPPLDYLCSIEILTLDRMLRSGLDIDIMCLLCGLLPECINHLVSLVKLI